MVFQLKFQKGSYNFMTNVISGVLYPVTSLHQNTFYSSQQKG